MPVMSAIYSQPRTVAPLLTPLEVAEVLGISSRGVRRLVARGDLAGVRVGDRHLRVEMEELASYIERRRGVTVP
jgi:excisionase family DNA binding protein